MPQCPASCGRPHGPATLRALKAFLRDYARCLRRMRNMYIECTIVSCRCKGRRDLYLGADPGRTRHEELAAVAPLRQLPGLRARPRAHRARRRPAGARPRRSRQAAGVAAFAPPGINWPAPPVPDGPIMLESAEQRSLRVVVMTKTLRSALVDRVSARRRDSRDRASRPAADHSATACSTRIPSRACRRCGRPACRV